MNMCLLQSANMTVAQDLIRDSVKSLSLWFDHYDRIMEALPEDQDLEPDSMVNESWQVVQAQVHHALAATSAHVSKTGFKLR